MECSVVKKKQLTLRFYENSFRIQMDFIITEAHLSKANDATTHTQVTDYLQTPYETIPVILQISPFFIYKIRRGNAPAFMWNFYF